VYVYRTLYDSKRLREGAQYSNVCRVATLYDTKRLREGAHCSNVYCILPASYCTVASYM